MTITRAQVRAIHIRIHRLGMDDATYRLLLKNHWGVYTCKDLTRQQAHQLIRLLVRGVSTPPKRKRQHIKHPTAASRNSGKVVFLATFAQHQLIHDLVSEVKWDHADGYSRWLKKSLGLKKVRSADDAQKVIQGLKGLKRHGHVRAI